MLAHGLTISPSEFGSKRSNAFVQFLNLRFSKNSAWWLVLKPVHESGEKIDIFHLDGCQLVLVVQLILCWH
jgi:hypothetical protein